MRIIEIVAARCQILRLECTKFEFGCMGLRPRPRWGAYSAFSDPVPAFKGPTSRGREGSRGREEEDRVG